MDGRNPFCTAVKRWEATVRESTFQDLFKGTQDFVHPQYAPPKFSAAFLFSGIIFPAERL